MIYNIILKPLSPFFWGTEQVSELGNKRSYYLQSALYPQQTAILGMLRYQALAQYGLLSAPGSNRPLEGKNLIGESSFTNQNTDGYGAIQQLSPVQLQKGESVFLLRDRELFSHKKDNDYPLRKPILEFRDLTNQEFIQTVVAENKFTKLVYRKEIESENPEMVPWIEKNEFSGWLIDQNHPFSETDFAQGLDYSKAAVLVNKVIQETGRVGIEKSWEGNTKSNAYYKQFFRELTETRIIKEKGNPPISKKMLMDADWKFSLKLYWDESSGYSFDKNERFVLMGGEQSVFVLSAEVDENCNSLSSPSVIPELANGMVYKLLLTSDTYISKEEQFYKLPLFVNAVNTKFRNFVSNVNTTKHYNVKGLRKSGFGQSNPSCLLKRGSILYFMDKNSLADAIRLINEETSFQKVGYNYYKIETEKYHPL